MGVTYNSGLLVDAIDLIATSLGRFEKVRPRFVTHRKL